MNTPQSPFKRLFIALIALLTLGLSTTVSGEQNTSSSKIAYLDDAKIFANFTDELPAVVNYFTQHNEQEIVAFYQQHYGEATRSQMKRGRLTLYFTLGEQSLRVIVSQQGKTYQVDALLH